MKNRWVGALLLPFIGATLYLGVVLTEASLRWVIRLMAEHQDVAVWVHGLLLLAVIGWAVGMEEERLEMFETQARQPKSAVSTPEDLP